MINHSGGCPGADMAWETNGNAYGITTIAYSFANHVHEGKNPKILSHEELMEGVKNAKIADKTLKRNFSRVEPNIYVRNLLARNWFQVKNAEAIFAVGYWNKYMQEVDGGTGWAVQMAVDNNKPTFFYDQDSHHWYEHTPTGFVTCDYIPTLTTNFAGIGTRRLDLSGEYAIKSVLNNTFHGFV